MVTNYSVDKRSIQRWDSTNWLVSNMLWQTGVRQLLGLQFWCQLLGFNSVFVASGIFYSKQERNATQKRGKKLFQCSTVFIPSLIWIYVTRSLKSFPHQISHSSSKTIDFKKWDKNRPNWKFSHYTENIPGSDKTSVCKSSTTPKSDPYNITFQQPRPGLAPIQGRDNAIARILAKVMYVQ